MPTGTVTATQGGSTSIGIAMALRVLTGQNASPIGISTGATNTTPSLATGTGVTTGSIVFFANLGLAGTYTVNGASTYIQNLSSGGLEYVSGRATATMTGGTSVTVGGTATANSISIALLEILKGAGSLTDTSIFTSGFSSTTSLTSGTVSPATGGLIVAMVMSNGGASVTTITMSDTLGGLTWTAATGNQNGAGNGFAGLFTAPVPAAVAGGGMLLGSDT